MDHDQYSYNPLFRNVFTNSAYDPFAPFLKPTKLSPEDFMDGLIDDNVRYNQARDANVIRIVSDLPTSYIDGGIILKEGITITRQQFTEMPYSDWTEFMKWIEWLPNMRSEEMLEQQLLWIYDTIPVITSLTS